MDNIREFDCILNKEDRDVVSDQIPVAFASVKFDGEPSDVTDRISRTARSLNCRKTDEHWRLVRRVIEDVGIRELGNSFTETEDAMSTCTTSMDNAFGDPFVVKVVDLE